MRPGATAIPLAAVNAGCLSRLEVATSALLALVQAKRILCWKAGADAFKVGCRSARAAAPGRVELILRHEHVREGRRCASGICHETKWRDARRRPVRWCFGGLASDITTRYGSGAGWLRNYISTFGPRAGAPRLDDPAGDPAPSSASAS